MLELEKLMAPSTRVSFNAKSEMKLDAMGMITPMRITKDMIEIIPEGNFNKDTKFLDIACKSGNFLRCIYNRLMISKDMIKDFPNDRERHFHIINNQLYGITLQQQDVLIATRNVYGQLVEDSHIIYIPGYIDRYISCRDIKGLKDKLKEKLGDMEFNVIVGNPPYNSDMYLDFVTLAKDLIDKQECDGHVCMITPAKWQAKSDKKNDAFRKDIVPYMDRIVFYPDTTEIFNIAETGGICYYTLDTNVHKNKEIKICSTLNKVVNSHEFEVHCEENVRLINTRLCQIIDKCIGSNHVNFANTFDFGQSRYIKNTDRGYVNKTLDSDLEVMQGTDVVGYLPLSEVFTTQNIEKYKVITPVISSGTNPFTKDGKFGRFINLYVIKPNQVPKGSFLPLKSFDSLNEANSFVSFYKTKLSQFLIFLGICGTTVTSEFFRFVPAPEAFDHIFTDAELYEKYGLTEEEINIIESVIKDRK